MAVTSNINTAAGLNLPASTVADLIQINPNILSLDPSLLANLAGLTTASSPLRVRPGDIISSDLFNSILARLEALEANSVTGLALGPLAANTHTLLALGTGFETGGGIYLDGQSVLAGQVSRGINLAILDASLTVKFRSVYDTFGVASAAAQLAADLQNHTAATDIVVVVTHDAYAAQLSASAKAALASVGGAALARAARTRDNAAFIGVVPTNRATANYNYLVSVIPADSDGFDTARLCAMPFVWGVYSVPLKRFLLGGAAGGELPPPPKAKEKETDKIAEKVTDTKIVVDKVTDVKATEAKITDAKLTDTKTVVDKVTDAKITDTKLTDAKLTDTKTVVDKVTDAKVADTKTTDAKVTDTKTTDAKVTDVKTTDAKLTDTKTVVDKVTEAKTAEVKLTDAKATDAKVTDAKLTDVKLTDAKATDAKATDVKLTDAKLTDAKATDAKAADKVIEHGLVNLGGTIAPTPQAEGGEAAPAGHAFIKPEERPDVGRRTLDEADRGEDAPPAADEPQAKPSGRRHTNARRRRK